jgi:hypothetical protein
MMMVALVVAVAVLDLAVASEMIPKTSIKQDDSKDKY